MEKLHINLDEKSYDIFIDRGIFNEIGKYISKVYKKKKIVVVTDTNVDKLYGDKLLKNLKMSGYMPAKVVFDAGEENKNFETLTEVYEKIIDSEIKRGDLLIAFGGGVVGDLAGFAASTIYRGIDFIQIPTTLLAQVDSSVGGKVAVDTTRGKNLVGSFYQPRMVVIDPDLLKTLDEREVRSGMAEVIKYGAIYDSEFFDYLLGKEDLKSSMTDIEKIIKKCCEIKAKIVEKDELDLGLRMILNFGHTLGHAIEKYYNYGKYTHGEAISIGMYDITKLGERLGITKPGVSDKIKEILKKYNLPIEDEVEIKDLIEIMKTDKKNISGILNFIFLSEIGKVEIKKVGEEEITNKLFK
ncbi:MULTISPECIES: 3-dehydroquinate synthase [Psychrilyobacter]|uniref:3-dehydroquinate synthase n=1 Tax=Psychrilyobacter piezotolerans TaxID=2293438 RepID=A0ABX9KKD2_9FUSO|nr:MULTISPECIES: 3-dehydroquinate synthase [Psychrilyobacter]MCS5420999.1 3-dehydroquinate synthase [Psychrilyobacter sp. S5]NDI76717.1 3-dehydroquinate synthase [Psychrilyobacter piezotolerans]RDE65338.1 3-dehydroquinate synthase [Psychrilyobacter sp. S5]REI42956.1 3-dehydroquinate synthase [Psychrilyobacter piezotolerans]